LDLEQAVARGEELLGHRPLGASGESLLVALGPDAVRDHERGARRHVDGLEAEDALGGQGDCLGGGLAVLVDQPEDRFALVLGVDGVDHRPQILSG
jgi:hypothetical protein